MDKYTLAIMLNRLEMDTVFRIVDGQVVEQPGEYAPTVTHVEGERHPNDVSIDMVGEGWSLLHGYTGQYGYRGGVMHPSEMFSAGMAADMSDPSLYDPGLFALVVVEVDDGSEDSEPAGWAVAYKRDGA